MKNDIKGRNFFTLNFVNPVVRILILSDLIVVSSYGLIAPIFAIFIVNKVTGGTIAVVGLASAIFLLAKSLFQIPFALLIDSTKGEKDDFWALFIGSIVFSLVPLFYLAVDTPLKLYALQAVYGLAMAALQPAFNAIWIRHIDRGHEGLDSGLYNTFIGIGSALTASLGGFIAMSYGFGWLFISLSTSSLIGTLLLIMIYRNMTPGTVIKPKKYGE